MAETATEMRDRHETELTALKATQDTELKTLMFVQADADEGKASADAHILKTPKTAALGITVGTETVDSKAVTLIVPALTGADAALWNLICPTLDCQVGSGEIRVHKSNVTSVLDAIESALP